MKHAGIAALALAVAATAGAGPLRDPFARPAPSLAAAAAGESEAPVEVAPQLRAIMYEPGKSLANIGGQIVGVGEWVGQYRVVKIQERSVTLVRHKVKTVVSLDNEGSK